MWGSGWCGPRQEAQARPKALCGPSGVAGGEAPVVSYGHSFEGGAHRSSGQIEWFLQGMWTQGLFLPQRDGHGPGAAPRPELGGRKDSLSTCRFTSRVGSRRGHWVRVRREVAQPTPRGFWQETHWGEALRVPQVWEVLLSEGEPPGARSPELYEPLRAGTWLAQVLVGRGMWPPSCPREGPADLDGTVNARAAWFLDAVKLAAWYYRWGHRSQEWKGQPRRHLGFACPAPGLWRGGTWVGAACWERPPGHSLHPLVGHVAGQPHAALVFLEACCQARAAGKAAGPCPQPAGPERGLVWRV